MTPRTLEHAATGDRVVILIDARASRGEVFRFEYLARAPRHAPADHVHAEQEERIEVVSGLLHCRVDGCICVLGPGDRLVIPPGLPHAVWNAEPGGAHAIGEFRPALDMERVFEAAFAGGCAGAGGPG